MDMFQNPSLTVFNGHLYRVFTLKRYKLTWKFSWCVLVHLPPNLITWVFIFAQFSLLFCDFYSILGKIDSFMALWHSIGYSFNIWIELVHSYLNRKCVFPCHNLLMGIHYLKKIHSIHSNGRVWPLFMLFDHWMETKINSCFAAGDRKLIAS